MKPAIRTEQGRFKPGMSGNPAGRPKSVVELIEHARGGALEVLNALREMALDPGNKTCDRLAAAHEYLDRGMGKPAQTIGGDQDRPLLPHRTEDEMRQLVIQRLQSEGYTVTRDQP